MDSGATARRIGEYLKIISDFTNDQVWDEIKKLCIEAGLEPQKYMIFKYTGGMGYVLTEITSDLFISLLPLDSALRVKLYLLQLCEATHESFYSLFNLNDNLATEGLRSWERERIEKGKAEILEKINVKIHAKIDELCHYVLKETPND